MNNWFRVCVAGWLAVSTAVFALEPDDAPTNEVAEVKSVPVIVGNTNDVVVKKAVEAMSVVKADEATEALEIEEAVRRATSATNQVVEGPEVELPPLIQAPEPEVDPVDPWDAFMPPPDSKFDWIQLTSGEWLKGELKVLYEYSLEFDSDEMDLQTFDFEDVKRVRTRGMKTLFVQGEGGRRDTAVLRGLLEINGEEVVLRRGEHVVRLERDDVISIAGGRQRERDNWSGMLSIGVTARGGNTETIDTTIIANIKRRTAATRFSADYLANYSRSSEIETANNQRLSGTYDRFLTRRFFWQALNGEYFRDPFSNIDNQFSIAMGFGYELIHTTKTEWGFGPGVGYQQQNYVSVKAGESDRSSSPFGTFGMRFEHEVTDSLDLLFDYAMRWLNSDNGRYTHHMVSQLSFDVIGDLDLDVSLIWDRIEKPREGENGAVPKQDDYQLIVGVAYEF